MFAVMCTDENCIDYIRFCNLDWLPAKSWRNWILRNEPEQLPRIVLRVGNEFHPVIIEKAPDLAEAL